MEGSRGVYPSSLGGHLTTINQAPVAGCGPVFVWMYILGLLSLVYLSLEGSHSCKLEEKTAASGPRAVSSTSPRPRTPGQGDTALLWWVERSAAGPHWQPVAPAGPLCVLPEAALVPEGAAGPLPTAAWSGDGHHCHRGVRGEGPAPDRGGPTGGKGLGVLLPAELGIRWAGFIPAPVPPGPLSEPGPLPPGWARLPGHSGDSLHNPALSPRLASGRPWRPCAQNGSRCCPWSCRRSRRVRPALPQKAAHPSSPTCACSVRRN